MLVKLIPLPIYEMKIMLIIDGWEEANLKYGIGIDPEEIEEGAIEGYAELGDDKATIYILLRNEYLTYNTISHEIFHAIMFVCKATGIKADPDNDESLAYLNGHISEKVFEIVDQFISSDATKKKK